ncbi:hypothetical protein F511_41376 [Dorcoceras hygrometricum]|uniref:Uncharacterized protein n=1 Tax=Dorcoceras hygrometricum TaxID=472368 RepID=A0A2Z7BZC0_9LAMI|nr:hypothetical protein F511_41376 [Dorcoceras hygrometricum]
MGRYLSADMVTSCFLLLCVDIAIADVSFAVELARIVLCIGFYRQRLDWFVTTSFRLVEATPFQVASRYLLLRSLPTDNVAIQISRACFVVIVAQKFKDARASGNTALSSPCWDLLATMRRVANYHSSWARQRQVELFDASGIWMECQGNPGFTAGRGFNPAGGAPGGG